MKDIELSNLRQAFAEVASSKGFEVGVAAVALRLSGLVSNADNWQLVFDLLYWDWTATHPHIHPKELDRLSLKYSPFGEHQEAVIRQQVQSAEEWGKALEEAGLSPVEALGLAKLDCEMEVQIESRNTAIAKHPSAIALPQEIVMLYRVFYRAAKRYNPERTNALKPLLLAKEVIQKSSSIGEALSQEIAGRITARMGQVYHGHAKGRWQIGNQAEQTKAIKRFSDFIVYNLLEQHFRSDKSKFSSEKGIGLIEDACYAMYVLEQDKENRSKNR